MDREARGVRRVDTEVLEHGGESPWTLRTTGVWRCGPSAGPPPGWPSPR